MWDNGAANPRGRGAGDYCVCLRAVLDDAPDPTKTVLEPGPFDNTLMRDNHPLLT